MRKQIINSVLIISLILLENLAISLTANAETVKKSYSACYSAGEKAYAVSDFSNAAESYLQALRYKPEDLRSRLKYAQSLFHLGKYDESQKHLQIVLNNSQNNIIARLYLAESFAKTNKREFAIEQLNLILNVQPNHSRAKFLMAELKGDNSAKTTVLAESDKTISPKAKKESTGKKSEKAVTVKKAENQDKPVPQKKSVMPVETAAVSDTALPQKNTSVKEVHYAKNMNADVGADGESEISSAIEEALIIKEVDSAVKESDTLILYSENGAASFTPFVAGQKKKAESKTLSQKPQMPAAKKDITRIDMESFFKAGKDSFLVTFEKARYEIEKGDLDSAWKTIELACKLARVSDKSKNILEAQILRSLVMVYKCDFTNFGKNIMALKSALSTDSYQSFLDIYSQSEGIKSEDGKRRLAAGVAAGAGHNAVVVSLLKPVFAKDTSDPILSNMLAEAQFGCYDYEGAGETLKMFAEAHSDNAEAQFNLARFYLTADYKPKLARKYATLAYKLDSKDPRTGIILGLIDYSEGKVLEGIAKIKSLSETVEDTSLKAICQRLIADGEENNGGDANKKFVGMLALPGAAHSDPIMLKYAGDEDLKAGSYFSAIEKYFKANEGVEVGRAYLGLASALTNAGEIELASVAAGYGVTSIKCEMSKGKALARASLYLALYDYERGDKESAIASIDLGLNCRDLDRSTYEKLISLYDNLNL